MDMSGTSDAIGGPNVGFSDEPGEVHDLGHGACPRCGEAFVESSERAEVVHYPSRDEVRSYGSQHVLLEGLTADDFLHLVVHQSCMIDGDELA